MRLSAQVGVPYGRSMYGRRTRWRRSSNPVQVVKPPFLLNVDGVLKLLAAECR